MDSTLYTSVWSDVRSCIVAAAPFVTNSTTGTTTAASINATYNDKNGGKPQVVIDATAKTETMNKFGGNEGRKEFGVRLECWASNGLGTDQLADQVETAIKSYAFSGYCLTSLTSDPIFVTPNDNKFYGKEIMLNFLRE